MGPLVHVLICTLLFDMISRKLNKGQERSKRVKKGQEGSRGVKKGKKNSKKFKKA